MAVKPEFRSVEDSGLPIMQDVFGPILNRNVDIKVAVVEDASFEALAAAYPENPVMVEVEFEGAAKGTVFYVYSQMLSAAVTDLMVMGDGSAPFNEQESLDGISEATNQIVGALCTFYSEKMSGEVKTSGLKGELVNLDPGMIDFSKFVKVDYKLSIGEWGDGVFTRLVPLEMVDKLITMVDAEMMQRSSAAASAPQPQGGLEPPPVQSGMSAPGTEMAAGLPGMDQPSPGAQQAGMGQQQMGAMPGMQQQMGMPGMQPQMGMPGMQQQMGMPGMQQPYGMMHAGVYPQMGMAPGVSPAQFSQFDSGQTFPRPDDPQNLDLLLDISLPVTIELGRTNMLIRDVLEIGPGSVIELTKLSGEPVDLYVNDKKFAMGEVVVIDENFGIRITELLREEDRIQALKP